MFFNPCSEAAVSFSDVRQLTARAAKFVYNTALELLRLSPSKAEKSNTSAKSLLGVTIKNTQTEQNLISGETCRDLYS